MREALAAVAVGLLMGWGGGCAAEDPPCASLRPGDLVISEVLPAAVGADDGREWFELFNATGRPVAIGGIAIWTSSTEGTGKSVHEVPAGARLDGQYAVFGGVLAEVRPAWVDYAYGADLTFRNTRGKLWLACGETIIDEVSWGEEVEDGVSRQVSSDALSASGNDDPGKWCDSQADFPEGAPGTLRATPGAPNSSCAPVQECDNTPRVGDLVITEVMADPAAVADDEGEWIEVRVNRDVDLAGLDIVVVEDGVSPVKGSVTGPGCAFVRAGTHAVIARNVDPAVNGGLPANALEAKLSLKNSVETFAVAWQGEVLSEAHLPGGAAKGASWARSPDDPEVWCKSTAVYGDGDRGTPGAPNPACP